MHAFSPSLHLTWAGLFLAILIAQVRADEYADNLAKWNSMRPAHYQYRYTPGCYCPLTRWQIEAKSGTVVAADKLIGDGAGSPPDLRMFGIDSLFRLIKGLRDEKPYKLTVTYDREFGFPDWISVDPKQNVADDESSITIDQFKVLIPGLKLSVDTVYEPSLDGIPYAKTSLAIVNTGDSAFYLNSMEMSVPPTDTFYLGTLSLSIHRNPSGTGMAGETFSLTAISRSDTIKAFGGLLLAPGDSIVFNEFLVGNCPCLRKAGTLIGSGKLFTLLLRFNLSRDKSAGTSGYRAYAWFRGMYDPTTSIERGSARLPEPAAERFGLPANLFPAAGRYYGLDGKPRKINGIPAFRIHNP